MKCSIIKETAKCHCVTSRFLLVAILAWIFSLAGQAACFAQTVALSWNPNTETSLAGYKVYYNADTAAMPFNGAGAVEGASPIDVHKVTAASISGLNPGKTYYFAITAYDSSGVESPYSNVVTVLESTLPTTAVTAPANNTTVSGTVSVTASASDNVGVTKLEFYVNGILQATDTSTPYVYSWNTSSLASGTYTLTTKAYDAAGNVGQSSNVAVTVVNDTTTPVVSLTAPGNSATVSGIVAITASASDNVGVSKVEFYNNGVLLYAGNVSPYSYNWNTASVTNGSYALTAKAYDAAGNVAQSSTVTVTVNNIVPDTTSPVVSAFSMPASAASLGVTISSLTATDAVGVTGYMVTESATAPAVGAVGWSASVPTSFTFSSAGSKTAYAWAKDAAGNVSASRSATVAVTLPDTTAPVVSAFSMPASAVSLAVTISSLTATDAVGVTGYMVTDSATAPAVGAVGWSASVPTSFTFSSAGSKTAYAWAKDAAGNVSASRSAAVVVNIVVNPPSGTYTAVFGNVAGANFPETIEDTYLNIDNSVNAASTILNAYTWPANTPANAIIMKWNLSALPANAQIQSATLSLYMTGSGGDALYEMPVSAIINKLPVIANSNGNTYDGANAWTASSVPYGGIPLAQSDIGAAVDAPLVDKTIGYKNWNVTNLAKDWAMTPANNKGLLVNSSSKASSDSERIFASSEAVDATQRPKLVVTYILVPDTTAPIVSEFTMPATATALSVPISNITATDAVGVTGYMITESAIAPVASATGWTASAPTSFTFSTSGSKTAYAWAKDAAGNVSASRSAIVAISLPDTTAPVVSAFSMPASATSLAVTISTLTATDAVGVTGYLITESSSAAVADAAGWSASVPASFTFSGAGSKTAYAWAKDAAGNVSASRSVAVTISVSPPPAALTINDALEALQIVVGSNQPTVEKKTRLDVSPHINGKSQPDGNIDIGDVVVILGKVTGKFAM